ncbi:MAG: hypothetical protein JG761_135 [Proteiniphilum sp.]|nr:hypothetical protein [Proteiniphilum sp.]
MKKEVIKPLLVDFDKYEYRGDLHKLEERIIKPHGKKIENAFEATGLGKLSNDYLQGIMKGDLTGIRKEITDMISKVLDPEYLSQEIANNVTGKMASLEHETRSLLSAIDVGGVAYLVEYVSVSDTGEIIVSEESKKRLKDSHSTFVTTEEGINRYNLHKAAAEAINTFCNEMGDLLGNSQPLEAFGYENGRVVPRSNRYE